MTFYAAPSPATVEKWKQETDDGFRFCFKLPKTITHDAMLVDVVPETEQFLERLLPLLDRLGPIMIQLPPNFGARELPQLEAFLETLPREFRYAVELRDLELATDGMPAELTDDLLEAADVGRVITWIRVRSATVQETIPTSSQRGTRSPIFRFGRSRSLRIRSLAWSSTRIRP